MSASAPKEPAGCTSESPTDVLRAEPPGRPSQRPHPTGEAWPGLAWLNSVSSALTEDGSPITVQDGDWLRRVCESLGPVPRGRHSGHSWWWHAAAHWATLSARRCQALQPQGREGDVLLSAAASARSAGEGMEPFCPRGPGVSCSRSLAWGQRPLVGCPSPCFHLPAWTSLADPSVKAPTHNLGNFLEDPDRHNR